MPKRLRLALRLLANLPRATGLAGGVGPLLALAWRMLMRRDAKALAAWLVAAVSHGQRANAVWYRRWLASRRPAPAEARPVSAFLATEGIAPEHLPAYLRLALRGARANGMDVTLVTNEQGAAALRSLPEAMRNVRLELVPRAHVQALAAAARRGASGAHDGRLIALFAPGCLPGEAPFPPAPAERALFYGDEHCIDERGRPHSPFFKPAWSPDLLMHCDYLSAGMAFTPALAARLPDALADCHSLALALAAGAQRIERVNGIVAQRFVPSGAAPRTDVRSARPPAGLPAFLRNRYGAQAAVQATATGWRCTFGHAPGLVSVIVPTRDRVDLLAACIDGIYASNVGERFEVIVVDNGSVEPATARWLAAARKRHARLQVLAAPGEFNWSRLNNLGSAAAKGEALVFLNNDTLPCCENWLARLADVALRPDVGCVGALLLYASGRIQHAGVALGFGGCADHVYKDMNPADAGHLFVPPDVSRNVAAVTGACMAISRDALQALGGFDEGYRVAGADVELCIRAFRAGLVNVYLPDVALRHFESQTRSRNDPPGDVAALKALVAEVGEDPWYHPALSRVSLYPSYPI